MAFLELRNGNYRVVFRFGGQKFARSLDTSDRRQADLAVARLEDNLRRAKLGTLTLDVGADVPTILLSSGKISQRPTVKRVTLLGELLDQYLASIPEGSLEVGTLKMLRTHLRHLKKHIGVRRRTNSIDHELLQSYINRRASEKARRGKPLSVTLTGRGDLTTDRRIKARARLRPVIEWGIFYFKALRMP